MPTIVIHTSRDWSASYIIVSWYTYCSTCLELISKGDSHFELINCKV